MEKRVVALFLVMIMIFTFPVYGAVHSDEDDSLTDTVDNDDSLTDAADDTTTDDNAVDQAGRRKRITATDREVYANKKRALREQYTGTDCENPQNRAKRIKCRLAKGDSLAPANTVPEACRLADNRGRCVSLYSSLIGCYERNGRAKDKCYKKAIGFTKAKLSDVPASERPQRSRDYVIALLYDLQERVVRLNEDGEIDPDNAADMLDKIVEIKESILNGGTRAEVRPMVQELRNLWRSNVADG